MSKILLVDDDPNMLLALQRELHLNFRNTALQIETFTNPFDALNRICVCDFDLIISDFMMPQMSGAELLQALKDVAPNTVRIMLSASTAFDTALSAINQAQAFRFMRKPWEPEELKTNVQLALELRASLLADQRQTAAASPQTPQEREARLLEEQEPGIMQVKRAPDGSIIL